MKGICVKLLDGAEAGTAVILEAPVYVYQDRRGRLLRCDRVKAQGVLSVTAEEIWQLQGKVPLERAAATVAVITRAEHDELASGDAGADPELTAEEALNIMMGGTYEAE